MKLLLLANTLFEALLALVLLLVPSLLFPQASEGTHQVLRVLAGNAAGFAVLSLLLAASRDSRVQMPGLVALAVFHAAVFAAQGVNSVAAGAFNPALIPHLVFAVCFFVPALRSRSRTSAKVQ